MTMFLPIQTFSVKELRDFTRVVIDNIAIISSLINIELRIPKRSHQQVKIGKSQVDMLAWNENGDRIVIEYQVKPADNEHLLRLARYHVSHSARIFVWIAESFDEKILAELKALNERDDAPFKVFPIALRVPYDPSGKLKPYFEVVERPYDCGAINGLQDVAPCVAELHPASSFWATFLWLYPDAFKKSLPQHCEVWWRKRTFSRWRVVMSVFGEKVGLWLTRISSYGSYDCLEGLRPHADLLEARLGVGLSETRRIAFKMHALGADDAIYGRSGAEWLYEQVSIYETVLRDVLGR